VLHGTVPLASGQQRASLAIGELDAGAYQVLVTRDGQEAGRARFVKQ
jgi:hypothetical protein